MKRIELFNLEIGEHFQIRKSKKCYTVHAHVIEERHDGHSGHRYILAVKGKENTMYAFPNTLLVTKV